MTFVIKDKELPLPLEALSGGPNTTAGLTTENSNFFPSSSFSTNSQEALSARSLLFSYGGIFVSSDQFSSEYVPEGPTNPLETAAMELTRTTRLSWRSGLPASSAHALRTLRAPSLAGRITSSSFLGFFNGKGEAT
uniref:Uncharacterized protein n=1 Tax=Amphimedon queenslandica TaxID=400682 RepID=A0A1X7VAV7_AMPQE